MSLLHEKAEAFRQLHHKGRLLILPNAWDVPSARVFEELGFPAVATSSAGLMVSLGYPDGQSIPRHELVIAVKRIARLVSVPLSVDLVAGFGRTPREVSVAVREIVDAGAVGLNIEDFDHATKKLYPAQEHVEKIKAILEMGKSMQVPIVVNARTDALRYGEGDEQSKFEEAVRRGKMYRDAGADCVYPMGLTDAPTIAKYVQSLNFPVNVMVRKGLPSVAELDKLGVRRVSFGPSASYAVMGFLKRVSKEVLEHGTYNGLVDGAISYDELNSLAMPRTR